MSRTEAASSVTASVGPQAVVAGVDPRHRVVRTESSTWAWIVLATLLIGTGARLYQLTHGTTFSFDEWIWISSRRGNDVGTFLRSYDGHFSLIPIAIYRLLFATAGLGDYGPYRMLVIVAHLVCTLLVFVYAKQRVGSLLALCAAALILFLGAGWQDVLWPFQIGWLISLSAGVGALLMLDRRDRTGDVSACVLLAVSLASSGVGVVIGLGMATDVLWGRRRWRDSWIVAAPCALYGLWWLSYQHTTPIGQIRLVPHFFANVAAASLSGLAGRKATPFSAGSGALLTWGRPLALVAVGLVIWRLVSLRRVPPRALSLLTVVLSFWFLTALTRTFLGLTQSWASRYLYVGGLFVVLLAVELARGMSAPLPARLLLVVGVAAAVVSNIGAFRDGAADLRMSGELTRADLGALQIGRPLVNPDYVAHYLVGYPLVALQAGRYFTAVKALGTPAARPAEITTYSEGARQLADQELIHIHQLGVTPARGRFQLSTTPVVERAAGGSVTWRGACVTFLAPRGNAVSASKGLGLQLSAGDLGLTATGGPATVSVRRFADVFEPVGTLSVTRLATLKISPDLAPEPWHVLVVPTARVTVCGLR
jgi:hypothetical protein